MKRYGMIIGLRAEKLDEYKELQHAGRNITRRLPPRKCFLL
jgi:hypothetical protein